MLEFPKAVLVYFKAVLLFSAFFLEPSNLLAQKLYPLVLKTNPINQNLSKQLSQYVLVDSLSLEKELTKVIWTCYHASYLTATLDSMNWKSDTLEVTIKTGNSFVLKKLKPGNIPNEWMGNFAYVFRKNVNFTEFNIKQLLEAILSEASNNGYPFASLHLDSVVVDSNFISASLKLDKNELFYFDSIDFGGTARISKTFLQQYTQIKPGMLYSESILKTIDSKLSELSYVQVMRPMGVYFFGNKARPYVYLNTKKASSFEGLIGFAPNSQLNQKLVVTGDLNLKLVNLMGSGKNLEFAFRGFRNNSQDLLIKFLWPYFLKSRLAIDYSFKLVKFDTTWIELFNDFGLQYRFGGNNFLKGYFQQQQISLISADTNFVLINKLLPPNHDVKSNFYGLAVRKSTLNYYINPSKGYLLELDASAGTKRIVENSILANLRLTNEFGSGYSIYDSVKLSTFQSKIHGNFALYNKFYRSFVILTQVKGGIISNQNLFENELFRIGGLKTLKGFDEQSIFANKYLIGNIELRYLFQQNSNFVVFWNGAIYENQVFKTKIMDKPWGLGAGMNLEMSAGIFSIYYAIGTQRGNGFEFQKAKLHFGLINYF